MPLAVELHPDADVLPGLVADVPSPPGLDDQGGSVVGLWDDLNDLSPQLAGGPQGIHQVQVVVRQEWGRYPGHNAPDDLGRRVLAEWPGSPVDARRGTAFVANAGLVKTLMVRSEGG